VISSTTLIRFSIKYAAVTVSDFLYFYRCSSLTNCQTVGSNTYITEHSNNGGVVSMPHWQYTANTGYLQVVFIADGTGGINQGINVSWATGHASCPAGQYRQTTFPTCDPSQPSGTACSNCYNCPAGKFSAVGGSLTVSSCTDCPAGKYSGYPGVSACMECQSGTYSSATAATVVSTCLVCPANTNSDVGSLAVTSCLCNMGYAGPAGGPCIIAVCNAGYTGPDGGTCSACAAGTYKIASGSAACSSCPALTTSPNSISALAA
jgi:hypothetical protein